MSRPTQEPAVAALTGLLLELRPDLPPPIAESLLREALDLAADVILDLDWARQRAQLYPEAVAVAHMTKHVLTSYADRRAREIEAAKPRPGDFHGRKCHCEPCHNKRWQSWRESDAEGAA